jgi:hypothetical protein
MKFNKLATIAFAIVLVALNACKKEESTTNNTPTVNTDTIPSSYVKIGETYIIGASAKAVVYSTSNLFVGYNQLFVAMYDSVTNTRLNDGHFEAEPMMMMGDMEHSCPTENQDVSIPTDKFWKANIIFTMAGNWHLHMHFHNHKVDMEGEGELDINVVSPALPLVKSTVIAADDSSLLYVTLVSSKKPIAGLNNFEVALHKAESLTSYVAVNDYTVEIEPLMLSMGHGSTGNINPTFTADGHYKGTVNYSMPGAWRVKITLKKNGNVMDNTIYFDVTI